MHFRLSACLPACHSYQARSAHEHIDLIAYNMCMTVIEQQLDEGVITLLQLELIQKKGLYVGELTLLHNTADVQKN